LTSSKKFFTLLALTLTLSLLLAACGQGADNNGKPSGNNGNKTSMSAANSTESTSTASPSPTSTAVADEGSADSNDTVTFHASNGDIQVPKNPKRIVDTTDFYTGYFLAMGIKPVGIAEGAMSNPYFKGMLDGVESIGNDISPEKILELNPDLIIVFGGAENIDKLEAIAPVVAIDYGKKNPKDQLLDFGKLTNKEAEAKAWVDQWENKISDLKPKIQAAVSNKTVSILNPFAKGLFVFGHSYGRGGEIIYGEFGLKAPPEAQKEAIDSGTGWASISLEKLPEFSGDIIFTSPWAGDDSDPQTVYGSPVWKGLSAVKAGNVFQLNPTADAYSDPISLDAQLDFISQSLLSVK
jgi:iron complex transport system substrate-binding protein